MAPAGFLDTGDKTSEFRAGQPFRRGRPQDTGIAIFGPTLAGDHQNQPLAVGLGGAQKTDQRMKGRHLIEAVQVESVIDILAAARQSAA